MAARIEVRFTHNQRVHFADVGDVDADPEYIATVDLIGEDVNLVSVRSAVDGEYDRDLLTMLREGQLTDELDKIEAGVAEKLRAAARAAGVRR